jgi:hypothetical protein
MRIIEEKAFKAYEEDRKRPEKYQTPDNMWMDWFKKGYKAAFEWINVNDRLPDSDRAILAKNEDAGLVWVSNYEEGRIIPYSDSFWGVLEATYWREIEIEL